jgi:hypothetical protein
MAEPSSSGSGQGEIALTVDETNALRAKLGLRPLRTDAQDAARVGSSNNPIKLSDVQPHADQVTLKDRLEQARAAREHAAREAEFSGPGLGALLTQSQVSATTSSRVPGKASESRRKAGLRGKTESQPPLQDAAGDDGDPDEGVIIAHDADDFTAGRSTILTLEDAPLLDKRRRGLASGPDLLAQGALRADEDAKARRERAAKAKRPVYDPYDGEGGSVLDHYDDYEGIDPTIDGDGLTGQRGGGGQGGQGKAGLRVERGGKVVDLADAEATRKRLQLARQGVHVHSSSSSSAAAGVAMEDGRAVIQADLDEMTPAEAAAELAVEARERVRKDRKRAKRARKAIRARTATAEDDDAPAGDASQGAKRSRDAAGTSAVSSASRIREALSAGGASADAGTDAGADRGSRTKSVASSSSSATSEAHNVAASAGVLASSSDAAAEAAREAAGRGAFDAAVSSAALATQQRLAGIIRGGRRAGAGAAEARTAGSQAAPRETGLVSRQRRYTKLGASSVGLRQGGDGNEDEDDDDYAAIVHRARSLALSRREPGAGHSDDDDEDGRVGVGGDAAENDDAGARVAATVARMQQRQAERDAEAARARARGEGVGAGRRVVITAAGEYTRRVGATTRTSASKQRSGGAEADGKPIVKSEETDGKPFVKSEGTDTKPFVKSEGKAEEAAHTGAEAAEEVGRIWAEVAPVSGDVSAGGGRNTSSGGEQSSSSSASGIGGMAAALAHMRKVGVGAQHNLRDAQAGRAKDERVDLKEYEVEGGDRFAAFHLEYRDEFGRHQTPKDHYRSLSQTMQGRDPSFKRKARRLKQHMLEQAEAADIQAAVNAATGRGSTKGSSGLLTAAKNVRDKLGQAFVKLE